jgi:hypothetical protein
MSLVVGHNCPGCGLDTPSVACEACGADVIWDRESGSHCGACGLSASTFTCPECGVRAELDKRQPEYAARAPAPSTTRAPLNQDEDGESPPPLVPRTRFGTRLSQSPALRTVAIVALAGLHGLVIAVLVGVGTGDGGDTARREASVAGVRTSAALVPERLARGAVQLSPDAKPVPLPAPQPFIDLPPPPPSGRLAHPPPPSSITKAYTGPSASPPHAGGWLQRTLRSGRASAPRGDHIPADASVSR